MQQAKVPKRLTRTMSELDNICNLCPRGCGVSRTSRVGFCRSDKNPTVAKVMTHFWEEPCISGKNGSGAVFFSGCNLGCIFCQNSEISHGGFGKEISVERLREIFRELENSGVNNINLVTPTHYADAVLEALEPKPVIPVIYNCGGYESVETLKRLEGKIQIYLPDMKYSSCELAKKLSLKTNAIIGVSGISDIVTDGKNTAVISGGHAMMKKITGSGCMLSSVIGAFAAANPNNLFYAVSVAFGLYASCGRNAYKENIGIATYKNNFFDEMTNPDLEGIEIEYR